MNLSTKISLIKNLRRLSLTIVILLLFLSPLMQLIRTFRQDPHPYPSSPFITSEISFNLLNKLDHQGREFLDPYYNFTTSGTYTGSFYDLRFTEPLTITNHFLKSIFNPSLLTWSLVTTFVFTFLLYFLFGRVYCSYICPVSVISNLNQKLQKKFLKRKANFYQSKILQYAKKYKTQYYVYGLLIIFNPGLLQFLIPPALLQHTISDFILFGVYSSWLFLFFIFLIFEFIMPGYYCKYLCPTGLFLTLIGKFRFIKLGHTEDHCPKSCTNCVSECWLGLIPKQDRFKHPSCDLCHRCATVCPVTRIVPVKNPLWKKVIKTLSIFIFLVPSISFGNVWNDKEIYHLSIKERTLYENEIRFSESGANYVIFYSIVLQPKEKNEKTKCDLNISILKNNKLFKSPIKYKWDFDKKEIYHMEHNYPISIGKRSVYNSQHLLPNKDKSYIELNIIELKKNLTLPVHLLDRN